MKKLIGMILALVMVFSLSVTAMAAEGSWDGTTQTGTTQDVSATYNTGSEISWGDTIYSVTIAWEAVGTITYNAGNGVVYQWDAANTKYIIKNEATEGAWNLTNGNESGKEFVGMIITVTNKSNANVSATVTATPNATLGVTGSVEGETTRNINSAAPANPNAENLTGSAQSEIFNYKITAIANEPTAPAQGETTVTVTTITVNLSK